MADTFLTQVKSLLTTPIPTKKILNTPIAIPGLSPAPKRRTKQPAKKLLTPGSAVQPRSGVRMVEGTLENGVEFPFSIAGVEFAIDASTWVIGELRVGAGAKAKLLRQTSGNFLCQSIRIG